VESSVACFAAVNAAAAAVCCFQSEQQDDDDDDDDARLLSAGGRASTVASISRAAVAVSTLISLLAAGSVLFTRQSRHYHLCRLTC